MHPDSSSLARARAIINPLFAEGLRPARNTLESYRRKAVPERLWHAMLDELAVVNGLVRSTEFTLDALKRGLVHGGAWGSAYEWPGCDHPTYFKSGRRAAAVSTEVYPAGAVDALRAYALSKGLALHMPPHPLASLWAPGVAHFVVLTAPGFGSVTWLDDQRTFGTAGSA